MDLISLLNVASGGRAARPVEAPLSSLEPDGASAPGSHFSLTFSLLNTDAGDLDEELSILLSPPRTEATQDEEAEQELIQAPDATFEEPFAAEASLETNRLAKAAEFPDLGTGADTSDALDPDTTAFADNASLAVPEAAMLQNTTTPPSREENAAPLRAGEPTAQRTTSETPLASTRASTVAPDAPPPAATASPASTTMMTPDVAVSDAGETEIVVRQSSVAAEARSPAPEPAPPPLAALRPASPARPAEQPKVALDTPSLLSTSSAERIGASEPAQTTPEARLSTATESATKPGHVVQQVVAAVRADAAGGRIEVRLDPPELGRVLINFNVERADVVTAVVSADRGETLDLLRRHATDLIRELQAAGFGEVHVEFASRNDFGSAPNDSDLHEGGRQTQGDDAVDVSPHPGFISRGVDNRLDRLV